MTTLTYTCDDCYETVSAEDAFVRSVNLRTVAWCRSCWAEKHPELPIPAQRDSETTTLQAARRRWVRSHRRG